MTECLNDKVEIIEEQEDISTISEEQFLFNQLNYEDTMEIIELMKKKIYKKEQEDKKIEKIDIPEIDDIKNARIVRIEHKINELIDEVNKLKGGNND
jgi:hypothetical protein